MLLRLATLGAVGYAAYKYYDKNRDAIDRALQGRRRDDEENTGPAGGPISRKASVVHAGQSPVD